MRRASCAEMMRCALRDQYDAVLTDLISIWFSRSGTLGGSTGTMTVKLHLRLSADPPSCIVGRVGVLASLPWRVFLDFTSEL
jgi:hypothetical protein